MSILLVIVPTTFAVVGMFTRRWALGFVAAAFAALMILGTPNWFWLMAVIALGMLAAILKAGQRTRVAQLAGFLALVLAIAMPGVSVLAPTAALSPEPDSKEQIEAELAELREDFQAEFSELDDELAEVHEDLDRIEADLDAIEAGEGSESGNISVETTPVSGVSELQQAAIDYLESQDFEGDEFTFEIDWSGPVDAGPGAFSTKRIESRQELVQFLNADSHESEAVRAELQQQLDPAEYRRAITGKGFVPVQLTVPAQFSGNTYLVNDQAVYTESPRPVRAGDVIWIHVAESGSVTDATTRADCANVRAAPEPAQPAPEPEQGQSAPEPEQAREPESQPVARQPEQPDEPEQEQPAPEPDEPDEPEQPDEPEPEQPDEEDEPEPEQEDGKDSSKDVLENEDVPDEVKGPGTTPPGGDPGEPDDPADHDSDDPDIRDDGCRGDCPVDDEDPEPDPERTPDSSDESDDPETSDEKGGSEQPDSSDGEPDEDDQSSGGGEDGVVEDPAESDDSTESDDSETGSDSPQEGDPNPDHDTDDPDDEPSDGSSEDTSDVNEDNEASGGENDEEVDLFESEPETGTASSSVAPSDSLPAMVLMAFAIAMLALPRRPRLG